MQHSHTLLSNREFATVSNILHHLKSPLIAVAALAVSASLVFGAQAPVRYAQVGSYNDQGTTTVAGDEDLNETVDETTDETTDETVDETTDETTDETVDETTDSADNCLTDPTTLTPEEFAAMSHGSIVCWAAHQDTPEGYSNHGAWVSQWAHLGKGGDAAVNGKAHGNGKAKPAK
jgi:hypothetical protein